MQNLWQQMGDTAGLLPKEVLLSRVMSGRVVRIASAALVAAVALTGVAAAWAARRTASVRADLAHTTGPLPALGNHPGAGDPAPTRAVASVFDDLATGARTSVREIAATVRREQPRPRPDRLALAPLAPASPALGRVDSSMRWSAGNSEPAEDLHAYGPTSPRSPRSPALSPQGSDLPILQQRT